MKQNERKMRYRGIRGAGSVYREPGRKGQWTLKYVKDGKVMRVGSGTPDRAESISILERLTGMKYQSPSALEGSLTKGYVYVVRWNDRFKIGSSKENVFKRISTLNTQNAVDLEIFEIFESDNAPQLEFQLHSELIDYRYKGEWFILDDEALGMFWRFVESKHEINELRHIRAHR